MPGGQDLPQVTLVVAVADNGVIGRDGALPWRLPEDLRRFKAQTLGKPVLMGRRTFESIGRALPGRRNIVLTRRRGYRVPDEAGAVTVVHDWEAALHAADGAPELMVIGGAEIYAMALPWATRVLLTRVHAAVEGDTRLPPFDPRHWVEASVEHHARDARNALDMSFVELRRRQPG
ncbi:MAG: dihydrofolate reductase [Gammaproteobacteria bacterium]|nr:dihydrofolate reductase [Gammaproteobacteria bacterium]